MNKYYLLLFLLLLGACNNLSVYNKDYYNASSPYFLSNPNLDNNFTICSQIFTNQINIDYQANLVCSDIAKQALFLHKKVFSSCYLTEPVSNVYKCV